MLTRRPVALALCVILALSLLLPACGESVTPTPTKAAAAATAVPAGTAAPAATATTVKPAGTPTKVVKMGGTAVGINSADGTYGYFDVHFAANRSIALWFSHVYESLLGHDPNTFETIPALAEKWEMSADAKAVTLTLRKGVKWHNIAPVNGREFTSADVKWNLERIRDLNPPGAHTANLADLVTVETPDKYTARIVLKQAYAPIIWLLSDPSLFMYPRELFDTYGNKQAKVAVGTGPFMIKSYEPNISLNAVKNPDYREPGLPRLDAFNYIIIADKAARIAALRSGQATWMSSLSVVDRDSLLQSITGAVAYPHAGLDYQLRFNCKTKPFNDPRVGRAISLALDRQELIKLSLQGAGSLVGFFRADTVPSGVARTQQQLAQLAGYRAPKDQDIAEAKKLLADAGYAGGLSIDAITISSLPDVVSANEVIKQQLQKIGVTWNIKSTEYAVATNMDLTGDYQAIMYFMDGGDADVAYTRFHTKSAKNVAGWGSTEVDKLLEQARSEPIESKRVTIYRDIEDKLFVLGNAAPVFSTQQYMVVRPELKDFKPIEATNVVFTLANIKNAWLDK